MSQAGGQLAVFAVGLDLFARTGLTAAVAMVALYALVPVIIAGVYGGSVIDASDRRKISLVAAAANILSVLAIALLAMAGGEALWPYYLLTSLNAVAGTIGNAARGAIIPRLLPRELLTSAAALRGMANGLTSTVAPALAGLCFALFGPVATYLFTVALLACGFAGLWGLPPLPPEDEAPSPGLKSILEGFRFIARAPNVRTAFSFDIMAMILCEPRVLFPAAGMLVIGGGPLTAGLLGGAVAVGSLTGALFSGGTRRVVRQGRATMIATAAYGLAVGGFGLVLLLASLTGHTGGATADPLYLIPALIALAAAGVADNATVIFRSAILQAAVPDHLRGRVQGLFTVVVTSGPRLGDLFAGLLTVVFATWAPPLIGATLLIALIILGLGRLRPFIAYDARHPRP